MTATTPMTTAPRQPLAPWILAMTAVLLIGALALSGARLTWDVPTTTVQAQERAADVSTATIRRANALAAARGELTVLRRAVREIPAIGHGVHDDMQLLAAVGAGHVPLAALDRRDHEQLVEAVNQGHVPTRALDPLE